VWRCRYGENAVESNAAGARRASFTRILVGRLSGGDARRGADAGYADRLLDCRDVAGMAVAELYGVGVAIGRHRVVYLDRRGWAAGAAPNRAKIGKQYEDRAGNGDVSR